MESGRVPKVSFRLQKDVPFSLVDDSTDSQTTWQFFLSSSKSFIPVSAFQSMTGSSSRGRTCLMTDASGFDYETRNLIARIWELLAKYEMISMIFVIICIPHSSVIMQRRQPANYCALDEVYVAWVSRKMKRSGV